MPDIFTYHLPFKKPFLSGAGSIDRRSGLIVHFRDDSCDVISEAAPLPGFSRDSLPDVKKTLVEKNEEINYFFQSGFSLSDLKTVTGNYSSLPSLQYCLETLGIEILCRRHQLSLQELFKLESNKHVQVNSVAGTDTENDPGPQLHNEIKNGFTVFKFKTGNKPQTLAKKLQKLHRQYPDITFRLDANQSWPADKVREFSSLFTGLPVEYIEEPARFRSDEELTAICGNCQLPVALDESISDISSFLYHTENDNIEAFIIKPMLFGSVLKFIETIAARNYLLNNVIVTSAFESEVGLNQIARIAALAGAKNRAHGLNTGVFFESGLTDKIQGTESIIRITDEIGFGTGFNDLNYKLLSKTG